MVIVQYWHSETVPEEIAELIASFRERNPELRHVLFDEASAAEFIGGRLGPRELAAFEACAVPAMQADYLRYCAVLRLGGFYADADLLCARPLSSILDDEDEGILFGWAELPQRWQTPEFEWRERAGPYRAVLNSLFGFRRPNHPLLELALEIATVNVENRVAEDVGLTTGPGVVTALYLLRELGSFDSFLEYARGGVLESHSSLICETIGDYERVERAFDRVRIPTVKQSQAWAYTPFPPPSYKSTEHWADVTTSIFR